MFPPAQTMFEKIWSRHRILDRPDGQTLLYVDTHLAHDGYVPAFEMLHERGLKPRRPDRTFGTPDHYVPTNSRDVTRIFDVERRHMVASLSENAQACGITLFDLGDVRQGIVHVIGPEQGITQPGLVIVCGDSHTSTHGALGALAFGIGMTEVSHALATQTLWQRKPKTMRIRVDGRLGDCVTAKDLILAIIARIGTAGATGHVIEYAGPAIEALPIEGRLTICNMSIEAGARAGLIAPDEKTYAYLRGRPYAPQGAEWDRAVEQWRALPSDADAIFDREVGMAADEIAPMVTWGTSPEDAAAITGRVPDPKDAPDALQRDNIASALEYMALDPGMALEGIPVDRVFIGSCTNGRIEDLRSAGEIVRGRKVRDRVEAWVVPGSGLVRKQAQEEGLDRVFSEAGFQWREAGCSMCLGTNGEVVAPGQRCASTSNRNFRGRQGRGARTHLMSPAMAAAAAIEGSLTDVRALTRGH
jgi:3-isopropylmalate/(R)-2-methylmalate dehydratase large subunit